MDEVKVKALADGYVRDILAKDLTYIERLMILESVYKRVNKSFKTYVKKHS